MDLTGAAEILATLVDHLRAKSVRSFRGELKGPDGATVWSLDMVFERIDSKKAREDE